MAGLTTMPFADRLGIVVDRCLPRLVPGVREQLSRFVNPETLEIMGAAVTAWVVSHAFGVGEMVDIALGVAGVLSIGLTVFSGLDELWLFAIQTKTSNSDADLDVAAKHLASAIDILGVQTVLSILLRGFPRGSRPRLAAEPPRTPGSHRYKPTVTGDPLRRPGQGATTFFGDIIVSNRGSAIDRRMVMLHERVHQILAPKFYPIRKFRVENRIRSYFQSSLWRFCEEALAETVAQVGVGGFRKTFTGIRFPVMNQYVFLLKSGGYSPNMTGRGVIPEGAALLGSGFAQGMALQLWLGRGPITEQEPVSILSGRGEPR
ncbi:MAG: hypothetical protein ACRYGI_06920 [Janthinobacterium lividum]